MIKQSKRNTYHDNANKLRLIEDHNRSQENSSESDIVEPQILSIKGLYGKKTLLELRKEISEKFLGSDHHKLQISEIGLAFENLNVSYGGNKSASNCANIILITVNSFIGDECI